MSALSRVLFRQADVTRAVKAASKAGLSVSGVEIDQNGKIVILTGRKPDGDARDARDVVAERLGKLGALDG